VQDAARSGAKLVVLPEMWNCPYSNDSFPTYAEDIDNGPSPSTDMLSAAAKAADVTLVGGSVPERSDGKLYNTCCVFDHTGKLLAKHRWVVLWLGSRRLLLTQCSGLKPSTATHYPAVAPHAGALV
jgi:omega-amidase